MNTVITINLNGKAYKLEEAGAEALRAYLDQAHARLADNPDKDEILKDFEQAMAEKFDAHITIHKNVVTTEVVRKSIEEMGPVHSDSTEGDTSETESGPAQKGAPAHKRLYRIKEGEKIWGVCTGLSAYFDVDVTIVRVIFVALVFVTHGIGIPLYIILALAVPVAETSEEKASARGENFNAHELIESLRKKYAKYAEEGYWHDIAEKEAHKAKRRSKTYERHEAHRERMRTSVRSMTRFTAGIVAIVGSVILGALAVGYIASLWSILATGTFFGITLLYGLSHVLAIITVTAAFYIPGWPVFMITQEARRLASPIREERDMWDVMSGAVTWGISIAIVAVIATLSVPRFDHAQVPYGFHFYVKHHEVCVGGNNYCQNINQ